MTETSMLFVFRTLKDTKAALVKTFKISDTGLTFPAVRFGSPTHTLRVQSFL